MTTMTMTMKLLSVFVSLLAFLPTSFATTYFKLSKSPSCTNGVSFSNVEATCSGYNCKLGESLTASGSVTFPSDVPESVCMSTKACFMGISSVDSLCRSFSDENVDLSEKMGLTSTSGTTYSFDSTVKIPGEDSSIGSGWWVTAVTTVDDCAGTGYTVCTTGIKAVSGRTMSYTQTTATVAISLVVLGAVAMFVRRRRVGTIDLAYEESRAGHFEMMSDFGPGSSPLEYEVNKSVSV